MIAVIILNWNNAPDTLECLASVYGSNDSSYQVFVADNGSTDGSLSILKQAYPQATFIENKENLGFAEGNNRAMEAALKNGAEYLFLLNNDAVVHKETLSILRRAAETHPNACALGAKIYFYEAPTTIWFGGADWNPDRANFDFRDWNIDESNALTKKIEKSEFLCGCALFIRSSQIGEIGLMDPRFFLNWEETDWCSRIRRKGYECLFIPQAKVWHKISRSFIGGREGPMWSYFVHRNRLLWMEKNLSWREILSIGRRFIIPLTLSLVRELFGPNRKSAKASLKGIRDYFFRRFGPGPYGNIQNL